MLQIGAQEDVVVAGIAMQVEEPRTLLAVAFEMMDILVDGDVMAVGRFELMGNVVLDSAKTETDVVDV